MRADHLGSYGYERPTSPVLDSVARDGVRFETVVSSSSWTLPAHMTLFTAMPPEQHGVTGTFKKLEPETATLASVLQKAGYDTAGFVAAPYLRSIYGYRKGFDVYDESVVEKGHFESHVGVSSPRLIEMVTDYLDGWAEGGRKKPFFVFLHLWDVHYDYTPPPPYDTMFDPDYDGDVTGENFVRSGQVRADMDPRDLAHVISLYDGEIRFTDEQVGRLLAVLDRLGVSDDTIVVLTSDHGEEFFEHGRKGHGDALYDETILIPWVLRYPARVAGGQVQESPVRLMDIAPTVLGLAGVSRSETFGTTGVGEHGSRDLSPWLLRASASEPFPSLLGWSHTGEGKKEQRAARSAAGKHITHANEKRRPPELFDLSADPGEKRNLAAGEEVPAHLKSLQTESSAWRERWSGHRDGAITIEIDDDHRRKLFLLGYLDSALDESASAEAGSASGEGESVEPEGGEAD